MSEKDVSYNRLIGTSIAAKMLVDTAVQIFNPFLGIIAAGIGVDVVTMGRLLSLRSLMGLFAPLFGAVADCRGYRLIIRIGLLITALSLFAFGLSSSIWLAAPAMMAMGIGIAAFVPTLQAYVSARLPYAKRARGLGMVEYSWALTGIIGLSLAGLIIARTSWRLPMFLLGAGILVMWVIFARMPAARPSPPDADAPLVTAPRLSLKAIRSFFALGHNARSTFSTMLTGGLNYFAAMQLMIIYGVWLNDQFGLGPASLGAVAFVLGLFDLAASVSVSLFTDRIGKRRSVIMGMLVSLVWYLLIPSLATGVVLAVLSIAVARFGFEFAIVSYFPLLSEQTPEQRGKVMTLGAANSLLFATAAGFTAPWLYKAYGIVGPTAVSAAVVVVALVVILALVRERYG